MHLLMHQLPAVLPCPLCCFEPAAMLSLPENAFTCFPTSTSCPVPAKSAAPNVYESAAHLNKAITAGHASTAFASLVSPTKPHTSVQHSHKRGFKQIICSHTSTSCPVPKQTKQSKGSCKSHILTCSALRWAAGAAHIWCHSRHRWCDLH
jgi:hypothetical protein